jgi:hypothetical protein
MDDYYVPDFECHSIHTASESNDGPLSHRVYQQSTSPVLSFLWPTNDDPANMQGPVFRARELLHVLQRPEADRRWSARSHVPS